MPSVLDSIAQMSIDFNDYIDNLCEEFMITRFGLSDLIDLNLAERILSDELSGEGEHSVAEIVNAFSVFLLKRVLPFILLVLGVNVILDDNDLSNITKSMVFLSLIKVCYQIGKTTLDTMRNRNNELAIISGNIDSTLLPLGFNILLSFFNRLYTQVAIENSTLPLFESYLTPLLNSHHVLARSRANINPSDSQIIENKYSYVNFKTALFNSLSKMPIIEEDEEYVKINKDDLTGMSLR